jgi:hypothetical protein
MECIVLYSFDMQIDLRQSKADSVSISVGQAGFIRDLHMGYVCSLYVP